MLVVTSLLTMAAARVATAKSLYVIEDINPVGGQNPVAAYNIGPDGKLTFQARCAVTERGIGPVGLALDTKSERLFITFESSNVITLVNAATKGNAATMREIGAATAEGAKNLAGIVYDQSKARLYCMDRNTPTLYVYQWDATGQKLVLVPGSPVQLSGAQAFGIALDEVKGELYVGGPVPSVRVFSTADWRLLRTISVDRIAISIAVDPARGYLYYGGSYNTGENYYLSRYNLANGTTNIVGIPSQAAVMGLGIDWDTGFVYISTGRNNESGGDELRVYDSNLRLIDVLSDIGNPTGLVVSNKSISYNPLRLTKTITRPAGVAAPASTGGTPVTVGEEVTYALDFDEDDQPLTNVSVVDLLPREIAFVRATGDGVYGHYDARMHSYTWLNPPRSAGRTTRLELVGRVEPSTPAGRTFTNSATLTAYQRSPATAAATAVTVAPKTYQPLRLIKTLIAGAVGGNATTPASVNAGDELTYRITFDNKDNNFAAQNIRLIDTLPPEVDFIRASDDRLFGSYDPLTHTYTWMYPQLASGESNTLDLVVRLDRDVAGGVRITNKAVIESDNTPLARAAVDVVAVATKVSQPLRVSKTVVGATGGDSQAPVSVNAGDEVTYRIILDTKNSRTPLANVRLTDQLPREVTFVRATGDRLLGQYEPSTHTYAWSYPQLAPNESYIVDVVVQVDSKLAGGTTITNTVTAASADTPAVTARVEVAVVKPSYPTLTLRKTLVSGGTGQRDSQGRPYVNAGGILTYALSFSNPPANKTVTQVSLVDVLPREVSFIRADGDRSFGSYDPVTHAYTWRYPSLAPGAEQSVNLVVQVNEGTDPNTVIGNSASIISQETATTRVQSDVVVLAAPVTDVQGQMYFKPDHLYRNSSTTKEDLMVVVHLPDGVGKDAISETSLVLTPGHVLATGQVIFGTSTQGKVLCFFDVDSILAATQGYGQFPLTVTGRLRDGRSFVCERTIWILKFGGP